MAKRQKNKNLTTSFLEYSNNDNSLTCYEKVEFELKALKDTTNIWNNSSPEYYGGDKEAIQESPTTAIESEHKLETLKRVEQAIEQKTTQEPIVGETQGINSLQGGANGDTSHIATDSVETNMNNTEEQIQTIMKLPDEERKQMTMGSSPDTNSTEVEMIDSTVNELIPSEIQMTDVLDTKDNTLAQQVDRSSAHSELHSMETATKATQPEDTDWLYSEGFKPVINKRSTTLKKNKQTDKSKIQDSEKRPFPYGKKGRGEKAKKGLSSVKEYELANLTDKLHEETAALANKWHLRSKERWIKRGEKSTKFFFSRYKARSEGNCEDLIKIPEEYKDKYEDTLDYIKKEYKNIYRKEKCDPQLADNLTTDLPQ
ncbi:20279_t:CDS:2, partial [Gigaspora rosea]